MLIPQQVTVIIKKALPNNGEDYTPEKGADVVR